MTVDFVGAPDESRVRINDWVAGETAGKVKDLFAPGMIDHTTRLVLTNAIYFNASWLWPFNPRDTEVRPVSSGRRRHGEGSDDDGDQWLRLCQG